MNLKIEKLEQPDKDWDKRVLENDGYIYQTTAYANYMKEALKMKLVYLIIKDESRIVGQLAVHYGALFNKYLVAQHQVLYDLFSKEFKVYHFIKGAVIIDKSLKKEIYTIFLDYLDELGKKAYMVQDVSLPINEDKSIYEIFKSKGFYSDSWGTVIIDTTRPSSELWANLEKSRRNIVRRGDKQNLEVKEARTKEEREKVIDMIENMSARNKIFSHPREYYHKEFEILGKNGNLKTFFIEKDGKGVATISLFLFGKRSIQTLVAHTDYSINNKISGTDFLEWYIIKWCHDNGYETYDLCGIRPDSEDKKDISLREYKMRWGGEVVKYPYFSKIYSRTKEHIVNLMRKIYK